MAFAGLKKQINKANQYMTEKMGGAEGTKINLDFMDMERKTDVTCELVEELQTKTKEFLQPNPTARAKMAAVKGISKLSGQAKQNTYPQPEGLLGDCMLTYGRKMGDESAFGQALVEMGESLKQMADVKYSLDDSIKQNFLEPLHQLQTKDLKEVMHHRKKLQSRRLDFDCKRRRQAKGSHISDDEIKTAEDKFAESLHLAQMGMFNLLENEVEQVAQLATFADALLEYHQQSTDILKLLVENLNERRDEIASQPRKEFQPKTLSDLHIDTVADGVNGGHSNSSSKSGSSTPTFVSYHNNKLNPNNPVHSSMPTIFAAPTKPAPVSRNQNNHNNQFNNNFNRNNNFNNHNVHNHNNSTKTNKPDPFTPFDPWDSVFQASPLPSPMKSPARTPLNRLPCCTALYDFEAENPGELGFKENDTITLINKIDENWYEGSLDGRTGYFPVSYVQVVVPLP
ncbi:endophilin-A isoform X1 [Chrysoperla carnea]|uniref:endophilin-A isoform X1 n=1 Tax=Chrysoperla carnea TaxID=189513 RepID=UPI001D094ADD|nr:endophilin-A isoform X1 [Chrysoperla carnea]